MKNVPEWEVGTYFREPIYRTKENEYVNPPHNEFFAHASKYDITDRVTRRFRTSKLL
jgi:hypothetical protein